MNLQERIVRWRGLGAFYEEKQCSALGDTVPTPGTVAIQCAAELEADLRELREALDKLIEAGKAMTCDGSEAYIRSTRKEWNDAHCALVRKFGPLRS